MGKFSEKHGKERSKCEGERGIELSHDCLASGSEGAGERKRKKRLDKTKGGEKNEVKYNLSVLKFIPFGQETSENGRYPSKRLPRG